MLSDIYLCLGCTKADICRWSQNPYSTQATAKAHKLQVVCSAAVLFGLSREQAEYLANRAGLSLHPRENLLAKLLRDCGKEKRRTLYYMVASERMIQYYIAGREPTKEALLAIALVLELPALEIHELLEKYGYCLSSSLENDMVVSWFLSNSRSKGTQLLYDINNILDKLELPMLMTKQTVRR